MVTGFVHNNFNLVPEWLQELISAVKHELVSFVTCCVGSVKTSMVFIN